MRLIFSVVLMMAVHLPAWATTYYVAKDCSGGSTPPNCSNANNGTSRQTAKLTIAAGLGLMSTSDTLIIGNGTYAEAIGTHTIPAGTSGARTIIQAENANMAILNTVGGGGGAITLSGYHLSLPYENYITFDGLKIDLNHDGIGIWCAAYDDMDAGCTGITFQNGTILDAGGGASNGAMNGFYPSGIISNNYFAGNGDPAPPPGGALGNHTLYVSGANLLVEENTIHCAAEAGSGIDVRQLGDGAGTIVRNNFISGCAFSGLTLAQITNGQVYNNVITNTGYNYPSDFTAAAILICRTTASGVKIWNNTIYNVLEPASEGIEIGTCGSSAPSDVVITNNIFYLTGAGAISDSGMSTVCADNLNVGSSAVGDGCSYTLGTADPLFTNAASGDFHLASSASLARAAGTDLSATFTTDLSGRTRLVPWDVGAYKYTSKAASGVFAGVVR